VVKGGVKQLWKRGYNGEGKRLGGEEERAWEEGRLC
jgi:hypothetical protein